MKLVPYDVNLLKHRAGKTDNERLLEEFVESDNDCVKIENWHHCHIKSAESSLRNSTKRFGFANVKVMIRGGELFLVKKE